MTACSDGCVMAASAARFWMFIGGSRPAAATAADSFWALRPGKYMSRCGTQRDNGTTDTDTHWEGHTWWNEMKEKRKKQNRTEAVGQSIKTET